jgi:hypothetical protein
MSVRIAGTVRTALLVLAVLVIGGLAFTLGSMVTGQRQATGSAGSGGAVAPGTFGASQPPASTQDLKAADEAALSSPEASRSGVKGAGDALTAGVDAMVIRNANLDLRVDKVESALDAIRAAARRHGATITDLSVSGGNDGGPRPLAESDAFPTPASASVVLRVDAAKLDALEADVSKVGKVLSQGASASDVTQQYVDLSARLDNLKAEEARLRSFTAKATKVSDLLEIERELARVRGDIEAMQAQVDYLKQQTARATLTVSLTEPGPIVQPGGNDWGFSDAIRRGIQGAATLLTGLITLLLALMPILVPAAIVWLVVRARRRRKATAAPRDDEQDSSVS